MTTDRLNQILYKHFDQYLVKITKGLIEVRIPKYAVENTYDCAIELQTERLAGIKIMFKVFTIRDRIEMIF